MSTPLLMIKTTIKSTTKTALRGVAVFLAFASLVACETAPPVQEMSDARQAIAVAREAGAESRATEVLMAAEQFLQRAEQKLNDQNYAEARRNALEAKLKALEASQLSEIPLPNGR